MRQMAINYIERLISNNMSNTAICVITDCFSRFIELYPVKDISSIVSAKSFLGHTGRYGAPEQISYDGGSSFVNEKIKDLIQLIGSSSKITTTYSWKENPIVERVNKKIMRHLRNIIFDKQVLE